MRGKMPYEHVLEWIKVYGPVFTYWLGNTPMVVLGDHETIVEAYSNKKNEFAGRPTFLFSEILRISPNSFDVAQSDWSIQWEVLRRTAHSAARKFAVSPMLPNLETTVVDDTVAKMKEREGGSAFDPDEYIYLMVFSILASIAAGKSYSVDDEELRSIKRAWDVDAEVAAEYAMIEFIPILKDTLYRKQWTKLGQSYQFILNWCKRQLEEHQETFQEDFSRDFCDELLHAKNEAERSDSKASEILNLDNLTNTLMNLFLAGTDTTKKSLSWMLLIMSNNLEIQSKLREEVRQVIGEEKNPSNEHRVKCHYVQAFISETLRFRPFLPMGLPHKTVVDTEAGGKKIPGGTMVSSMMVHQMGDEKVWKDPQVFNPERFIDPETGEHSARLTSSYYPFSLGRRSCIGERLALINLFIILTRMLQRTSGQKFVLENGPGTGDLSPDPEQYETLAPKKYKIMIVNE